MVAATAPIPKTASAAPQGVVRPTNSERIESVRVAFQNLEDAFRGLGELVPADLGETQRLADVLSSAEGLMAAILANKRTVDQNLAIFSAPTSSSAAATATTAAVVPAAAAAPSARPAPASAKPGSSAAAAKTSASSVTAAKPVDIEQEAEKIEAEIRRIVESKRKTVGPNATPLQKSDSKYSVDGLECMIVYCRPDEGCPVVLGKWEKGPHFAEFSFLADRISRYSSKEESLGMDYWNLGSTSFSTQLNGWLKTLLSKKSKGSLYFMADSGRCSNQMPDNTCSVLNFDFSQPRSTAAAASAAASANQKTSQK